MDATTTETIWCRVIKDGWQVTCEFTDDCPNSNKGQSARTNREGEGLFLKGGWGHDWQQMQGTCQNNWTTPNWKNRVRRYIYGRCPDIKTENIEWVEKVGDE